MVSHLTYTSQAVFTELIRSDNYPASSRHYGHSIISERSVNVTLSLRCNIKIFQYFSPSLGKVVVYYKRMMSDLSHTRCYHAAAI
jgi:hypothetical protein